MSDSSKQDKKNQGAIKEAKETEPTRALSPFEEMDRMVENFFSRGWMPPLHWPHSLLGEWEAPLERKVLPLVDVINRDHELVLHAQVPGVKKEDLDVSVTENTVTIKGTTSHEKKEEKGTITAANVRTARSAARSPCLTMPIPPTSRRHSITACWS